MFSDTETAENFGALSIPPFNPNKIATWFTLLQSLFSAKRITSQRTRYIYLVQNLPMDIAQEVQDLLDPMPEENPYDTLKAAILKRTGKSNESNLRDLFNNLELGYRTPSQLLRHMKSLVNQDDMSENAIRRLWLDKLPTATTQILTPSIEEVSLEKLADIADRIHVNFNDKRVAAVRSLSLPSAEEFYQLKEEVKNLTIQLQALLHRPQHNPHFRGRSNSRGRQSNSRSRDRSKADICYYHKRFGDRAYRCITPCTYAKPTPGNENSSQ